MLLKKHIHGPSVSRDDACWVMSSSSSPLTYKSWGWIEVDPGAPPFPPGSQCPWGPWAPPGPDPWRRPSQSSLKLSDAASPPLSCHPPPARNQTSPTSSSSLLVPVVSAATWIICETKSRHTEVYLCVTSGANMFKWYCVFCISWVWRHDHYRPSPHGLNGTNVSSDMWSSIGGDKQRSIFTRKQAWLKHSALQHSLTTPSRNTDVRIFHTCTYDPRAK